MMNIGKPYERKPHVRFDEEGLKYFQPFTLPHTGISFPLRQLVEVVMDETLR